MTKPRTNQVETLKSFHTYGRTLLCACTGKPCVGECREKNLNRKRADASLCPSAFIPQQRKERYDDDDE